MTVYFVRAETGGPVKIGYAADPARRLHSLQTGNHQTLVILATTKLYSEKTFHKVYEPHRMHGEWFEFDGCVQSMIEALRRSESPVPTCVCEERERDMAIPRLKRAERCDFCGLRNDVIRAKDLLGRRGDIDPSGRGRICSACALAAAEIVDIEGFRLE